MAEKYGAALHVMTVLPDFGMSIVGSYFDAGFEKKAMADIAAKLQAYVAENVPAARNAQTHVGHGSIYQEVLRIADEVASDAIVMAAHRPELKDYLLGPNAARVMRHANQSVFVIRD